MKTLALSILTSRLALGLLSPITRRHASILMLHRFADPATGNAGHDLAQLRANLARLRRDGFRLVSLPDLVARLRAGEPPHPRTVVFTIDDGYADVKVAEPVFAEFDCPATVFAITGFVDRACWCWWDRVEYMLSRTGRRSLEVELGEGAGRRRYEWAGPAERVAAIDDLTGRLKLIADSKKEQVMTEMAAALDAPPPPDAPREYAALSWDEIRAIARRGVMTFAPHTVSHPILTRVNDADSEYQIAESWRRVRAEVPDPVPVFCYPNGDPASYGVRERETTRREGLVAAVSTVMGHASLAEFTSADPLARYAMPRFPYPDSTAHLLQFVGGVGRVKAALLGSW